MRRCDGGPFGAVADGVDIVKDRFGPEVVGEGLPFVRGAGFERKHGCGQVHGFSKNGLEVCCEGEYGFSSSQLCVVRVR